MRLCNFPGCERFPHATGLHTRWDAEAEKSVPLAEQRTRAEILAESRERMRREKAERIAREALDSFAYLPGDRLSYLRAKDVATAAALTALTESEAAL